MAKEQIIALGGGGFSMEESHLLDDYILNVPGMNRPRICFVATASGDSENYIVRFYSRFNEKRCQPSHLELFRHDGRDLTAFAQSQDIIYVGGGNTANMLAIWKLHGFDLALKKALASGTVLAGLSAGSICWFQQGVTDSFGGELGSLDGLGFLPGSHCPHYDGEANRRKAYHRLIGEGMKSGIAADDGAALHYINGKLTRLVSSRQNAGAYQVSLDNGEMTESTIPVEWLGDSTR